MRAVDREERRRKRRRAALCNGHEPDPAMPNQTPGETFYCDGSCIRPCRARLAYRDMGDIGSNRTCGNPGVMPGGYCGLHHPATRPRRDAKGRILPWFDAPPLDPGEGMDT